MLVLTRAVGEALYMGNDIKMVILEVRGNQVRLGIEAPKTIPIHREEIYEKIQRNEQRIQKQLSLNLEEE